MTMDFTTITGAALAAACLYACYAAWRDKEPRQDVTILGVTSGAFGLGTLATLVM
jgi:drug/metabolite transporter (DMT)-like permease